MPKVVRLDDVWQMLEHCLKGYVDLR